MNSTNTFSKNSAGFVFIKLRKGSGTDSAAAIDEDDTHEDDSKLNASQARGFLFQVVTGIRVAAHVPSADDMVPTRLMSL